MRYQIIARRMSPSHSDDYRHVVEVQYRVGSDIGSCRREQMVTRLGRGDTAYIAGDDHHSEVGVFDLFRSRACGGPSICGATVTTTTGTTACCGCRRSEAG